MPICSSQVQMLIDEILNENNCPLKRSLRQSLRQRLMRMPEKAALPLLNELRLKMNNLSVVLAIVGRQ